MRKNIDLPKKVIYALTKEAKKNRMKFKPFAESILICMAGRSFNISQPFKNIDKLDNTKWLDEIVKGKTKVK